MSVSNDGKLLIREPLRTERSVEVGHSWLIGFGRKMAGRMGSSDADGREKFRINCNAAMVDVMSTVEEQRRRQVRDRAMGQGLKRDIEQCDTAGVQRLALRYVDRQN